MRVIKNYQTNQKAISKAPVIMTKWLDTVIPASYSLIKKIDKIVNHQLVNQVTTISLRAREGKGKTTVAKGICHLLHKALNQQSKVRTDESDYIRKNINELKKGYCVRILGKDDLVDFQNLIQDLPKQNRILVFDDLSFLGSSTSKFYMEIKAAVTTVRHIGDEDFKTVLIFNFHQTKALDNYLRDTNFLIQVAVSTGERKNLDDLYGTNHKNKSILNTFYKLYNTLEKKRSVTISLSPKHTPEPVLITIKHSDPFRLALFFDGEDLRIFVFPHESKLGFDECVICNTGKVNKYQSTENLVKICKWIESHYSQSTINRMLHTELVKRYGRDPINKNCNQIVEIVKRLESNGLVKFEDLYLHLTSLKIEKDFDLEDFKKSIKRNISISDKKRKSFHQVIGADGLRPPHSKKLDTIIDKDNEDLR